MSYPYAKDCNPRQRRHPMFRITFSKLNVKRFQQELDKAYKRGDKRTIRHLSVLLMIGSHVALATILTIWNVS